jgi:O-acetyl-ADP-ribose deacetylase (regulator of RNase III)
MKTVSGDLIKLAEEGHFDFIVHGCNCFCVMGAGIARQLADKYPQVESADKCTVPGAEVKLGFWTEAVVECENNHVFTVINAYTQYKPSYNQDVFEYDKFQEFLNRFSLYIDCRTSRTSGPARKVRVGFPMIGAGLAGGDWNRISKMIENFSNHTLGADVTIVEYKK